MKDQLQQQVKEAVERLKIDALVKELQALEAQSQEPDFWQDNTHASKVMQTIADLRERTEPWVVLQTSLGDLRELEAMQDSELADDIQKQYLELEDSFKALKLQLRFDGPYDTRNAVISIHAGAGGTDAQDWAQMLLRMYVRWAEQEQLKVVTLDESAGEEAGIKSVSFEVRGVHAYGRLKGEHGVHRLVRQSPFNADAKRQTSFAKVEVLPEIDEPEAVPIDEKDLKIDVFRAGGHGGQSVNTTDSAVRVTHVPTGIVVSIQNERSQLQNKETAMTILRSKLVQLQIEQHSERISELRGENQEAAWGNQIRNYVMHPYSMVKDVRTRHETTQVQAVLDGDINQFINTYLDSFTA
jgi:peptide chain release factor 2